MATYTINFVNNSSSSGSFCVFQKYPNSPNPDPDVFTPDVFALAWLAQFANPHSRLPIGWNTDFYFFWAKTGRLAPGVIFNAGEALRADPGEKNCVSLTKRDGNYKFIDQRKEYQQGTLLIFADNTMASNQASVGIGMSGSCTFAQQAYPNWTYQFKQTLPQYWVTFGDLKQGQVLDPSGIKNAVQIEFPYGIYIMDVTLNADKTWTVIQGPD